MSARFPVTPQLARLIVLEWQLANAKKMRQNLIDTPEVLELLPSELQIMVDACDNQIQILVSNITYQRRQI